MMFPAAACSLFYVVYCCLLPAGCCWLLLSLYSNRPSSTDADKLTTDTNIVLRESLATAVPTSVMPTTPMFLESKPGCPDRLAV